MSVTPTTTVDLTGIVNDKGKIYAFLTDGRRHWIIRCEAKHIQNFDVFQEHVSDSRGILINHPSQHRATSWERAEVWNETVQVALERGKDKPRRRGLVAAKGQLADLATLLRPYATTDLSDAVTRSHYFLLRARATLNDAIAQEGAA